MVDERNIGLSGRDNGNVDEPEGFIEVEENVLQKESDEQELGMFQKLIP